jgi:hypothetical protein
VAQNDPGNLPEAAESCGQSPKNVLLDPHFADRIITRNVAEQDVANKLKLELNAEADIKHLFARRAKKVLSSASPTSEENLESERESLR